MNRRIRNPLPFLAVLVLGVSSVSAQFKTLEDKATNATELPTGQ